MCTSLQRPVQYLSGYFCITGKNRKRKKLNEKTPTPRYLHIYKVCFLSPGVSFRLTIVANLTTSTWDMKVCVM